MRSAHRWQLDQRQGDGTHITRGNPRKGTQRQYQQDGFNGVHAAFSLRDGARGCQTGPKPQGYRHVITPIGNQGDTMSTLSSQLNPRSADFQANARSHAGPGRRPARTLRQIARGGGEAARAKHVARGKLLPRERVEHAARSRHALPGDRRRWPRMDMYDNAAPGAGMIAGIGRVSRRGMHDRVQRCHRQGRHLLPGDGEEAPARTGDRPAEPLCPASTWWTRGGANLPRRTSVFPDRDHFGRIFYNQANLCAQGIPQIAVVMGSCTAGGAYVPAMSDEDRHRQANRAPSSWVARRW